MSKFSGHEFGTWASERPMVLVFKVAGSVLKWEACLRSGVWTA